MERNELYLYISMILMCIYSKNFPHCINYIISLGFAINVTCLGWPLHFILFTYEGNHLSDTNLFLGY